MDEKGERPATSANQKLMLEDTLTLEQLRRRTRSIITHIMGKRGRYDIPPPSQPWRSASTSKDSI
eukprot:6614935-Prorocentrum_lima.AAC.1